jgi:hypothetical protein
VGPLHTRHPRRNDTTRFRSTNETKPHTTRHHEATETKRHEPGHPGSIAVPTVNERSVSVSVGRIGGPSDLDGAPHGDRQGPETL